jgi:hypothetical protein
MGIFTTLVTESGVPLGVTIVVIDNALSPLLPGRKRLGAHAESRKE